MGRKTKYTPEQKIHACIDYLRGIKSAREIAGELSMGKYGDTKILFWVKLYKANGAQIFINPKNHRYTKEFKEKVVREYQAGSSLQDLASKYGIPSNETVRKWVIKYNSHIEQTEYDPHPEVRMAKNRKTTFEERLEIVQYCIDHQMNYSKTAADYECSYGQVYSWVRKWQRDGDDGLRDGRGRRKSEDELTEVERLQRQLKIEQNRNKLLAMENELLKKVKANMGR
jgi:transposase-like protein